MKCDLKKLIIEIYYFQLSMSYLLPEYKLRRLPSFVNSYRHNI